MKRKFWNWVKNEGGPSTERTLFLSGEISDETWYGDEVTPKLFKDELNAGEGDITVWLNSPGGDVFAAAQIYNMLRDYKGNVTIKIDGLAASAASVIAMAGNTVLVSPVAMMMIHNPATLAVGNAKDMERAIAMLNEVKEELYVVRGNCDAEVDQMVLEFPIMADYAMITEGDLNIFVTHGHHFNEKKLPPMFEKTQEGSSNKEGSNNKENHNILLHGHTHVPVCRVHESYTYMNPGSVSIPKENSEHSYMILENGAFWWKTLDGETYLNFKGSKPERGYCREEYR